MKKLIFILFLILISNNCLAENYVNDKKSLYDDFLENSSNSFLISKIKEMEKCKINNFNNLQKPENFPNHKMIEQEIILSRCYDNITFDIFNKFYKKRKDKLKNEYNEFIKSSDNLYKDTYINDKCSPNCGTLINLLVISDINSLKENYLLKLINETNSF